MKLQEKLNSVVKIAMEQPLLIFGSSLTALVLSALSLSILSPVLAMGMAEIFTKLDNDENATFNDLFIHIDKVLHLFLQALLILFTAAVSAITVVGPLFIFALWIYGPYNYTYKNMSIIESLKASANAVIKNNLLLHIALVVIVIILFAVGAKLFAIGTLLVYPLVTGFVKFLYDEIG